jgi:serine/threonine-protein kinase
MAPELWKGEKATVQSDIYALGVILCELMTGQRPRVSDTPGGERRPVSRDLSLKGSLSHHRWAQTIQRCLDPDPARRFSSVNDITAAAVPRPSRRGFQAKLALGCASAVTLFFWLWFPKQQISSVAVLPFLNGGNTPESEFLAEGLSEGLLDALSQLPDLTVIARSSAAHFRGGNVDLRKAARVLNVRALITGRVAQLGKSLRVT